jgi:glucose-1-phosphate thymidylyltransferase
MRIIIPMAGIGKRMRPHTLTTPKPLLPVAGKPIVQWLVEDIVKAAGKKVEEIAYVIGDFGKETEKALAGIASKEGAKSKIYYQQEALGTGHAILCAADSLKGEVVVAFADTLFRSDFSLDAAKNFDGVIWVKKIEDPRSFGVVTLNKENVISGFVEKPQHFVSDLAIIGIYYFRDGETLKKELQYLIDNNIRDKGEYQLTNAMENMRTKGAKFIPGTVDEWLDCGNKEATLQTNKRMLELADKKTLISSSVKKNNSVIIEPCYIGSSVVIENSVVGPYVSVGNNSMIKNSVMNNSIILGNSQISNAVVHDSMLGNNVTYAGMSREVNIGDYSSEDN